MKSRWLVPTQQWRFLLWGTCVWAAAAHGFESVEFERSVTLSSRYYVDIEAVEDGEFYALEGRKMRIERYGRDGRVLAEFGSKGRSPGTLNRPVALAVNDGGWVYVLDAGQALIHRFMPDGSFLGAFGGSGSQGGELAQPVAIAVGARGFVYVADAKSGLVNRYTPEGIYLDSMRIEAGTLQDLAADHNGRLHVVTEGGQGVYELDFAARTQRVVESDLLKRDSPGGLFVDGIGNFYVVQTGKARVDKLDAQGQRRTSFGSAGGGRGQFKTPTRISGDDGNRVFVLDRGNERVQVLAVGERFRTEPRSLGTLMSVSLANSELVQDELSDLVRYGETRIALTRASSRVVISGDQTRVVGRKGRGEGELYAPEGLDQAIDGRVFVADTQNHRVQVFDRNGQTFSFGTRGKAPGQFDQPYDLAITSRNHVYVADTNNDRVQVFTDQGILLGEFGGSSDARRGEAPAIGTFDRPTAIALGSDERVYVLDSGNLRVQVFDPAGNVEGSIDLPAGTATPVDIALDEDDTLYVADQGLASVLVFEGSKLVFKFGSRGFGAASLRGVTGVTAHGGVVETSHSSGRIKSFQLNPAIEKDQRERAKVSYFVPTGSLNNLDERQRYRDIAVSRALATLAERLAVRPEALADIAAIETDQLNSDGEGFVVVSVSRNLADVYGQAPPVPTAAEAEPADDGTLVLK